MNIIQELADNVVSRNWSGSRLFVAPGERWIMKELPSRAGSSAVTAGADPAGS